MKLSLQDVKSKRAHDRALTDYNIVSVTHWTFEEIDDADPIRIAELMKVHSIINKYKPKKSIGKKGKK